MIVGALIIRDRDAAFLAYKNGDYGLALEEFKKDAATGDPVATYFVGRLYFDPISPNRNYQTAAQWFWKSAKLGQLDSAVWYLAAARRSPEIEIGCGVYMELLEFAAHTGHVMSMLQLGDVLESKACGVKDYPQAAFYYLWASELKRSVGSKFEAHKSRMNKTEIAAFELIKAKRPPLISREEFFKRFFTRLKAPVASLN